MALSDPFEEEYEELPPRRMVDDNRRRIGPFWDWYNEYLESPVWRRKSAAVIKRANRICALCGCRRAVEADHLTYKRVGRERPEDLQALCHDCHQRKTQARRARY